MLREDEYYSRPYLKKAKMDRGPDLDQNEDLAEKQPLKSEFTIQDGLQVLYNKPTEHHGPDDYDEAIESCGYGKFHYFLLMALLMSCCAQGFASGSVSYVLPSAECDLGLTNSQKGALNAAAYVGMTGTVFLWGFISDIFGRRKLLVVGFFSDFSLNFLSVFAHKFWLLLPLRICVGVSISCPSAALLSYLAEIHSREHRPRVILIYGAFHLLVQCIQPILAYLLIPMNFRISLIEGVLDFTSWRLFMLVCSMPSLMSALVFLFYPESPKFLMSQGNITEALQVFRRIYSINNGNRAPLYHIKELQSPARNDLEVGRQEKINNSVALKKSGLLIALRNGLSQVRPIFSPPYLNTALLLFAIKISLTMCFTSLRLWTPQLFATLVRAESDISPQIAEATTLCDLLMFIPQTSSDEASTSTQRSACVPVKGEVYLRSLLIGVVGVACFIVSTPLIGPIGKKNLALTSTAIGAAVALSMHWAVSSNIFMVLMGLYVGILENGMSILSSVAVDCFPTDFRSVALSLQMMSGRIGSMCGNVLFPILMSISCNAVFFSIAGGLVVVFILFLALPKREEKN